MNKRIAVLVFVLLVALVLSACAPSALSPQEEAPTVSVNGTGSIILTPDMATIFIGVQTEDDDAESAVERNNVQTQRVIDTLEAEGVAAEDIRTTNFSVYPRQDYVDGEISGVTYVVDNTVLVTVRDLEGLGALLDLAVKSGANTISGIQFDLTDREAANEQAMEAAVENAHLRAEILADAAGAQLGEVQSIQAYISGGGGVMPYMERGIGGGAFAVAETAISPGQMEVVVDVSVVYELVAGGQ